MKVIRHCISVLNISKQKKQICHGNLILRDGYCSLALILRLQVCLSIKELNKHKLRQLSFPYFW